MIAKRNTIRVSRAASMWGAVLLFGALFTSPVRAAVLLDQPITGALGEQMSQNMTDYPESSIYAFDDFTITGGTWTVSRVTAYIYDYSRVDAAIEDIRLTFTDRAYREPGNVGYAGRLVRPGVAATLVFDLPNVVLSAGKHWLSAWVKGPYDGTDPDGDNNANVIVEVRWRLTTPVRGSQFYIHNPGGGWGYGADPQPGSVAYGSASDLAFLIEGTKNLLPTVTATTPTGTTTSAELPTLTATFSAAMNKTTAQAAFSISPAKAAGVAHGWPGTFSWVGNKLQYKLSTSLAPNKTYTVKITKAAKSAAGVAMAADKTWTFKTNGQPAVVSYAPTGTAVPLSTTGKVIKIAFNQAMNKASAQDALWVYKTGTTPSVTPTRPAGAFSWVGNEMRYTLTSKLAALTSYTVKLGTGAKSSTGVRRTVVFTWTFKTGGAATSPNAITVASAPTASGAQITLNLASAAAVTVSLRNLAGREVAVLTPGELAAGVQSLLWNGKSKSGTRVPAGMYLVQVTADSADGTSAQAMTSLQLR